MSSKTYECVVIGAGFAGLMAARGLVNQGRSVLVLEARNRIGGRAESYAGGGHSSVDLGCSWIHGFAEGAPTRDLIKSLEIAAHVPKPADSLMIGPDGVISPALASKLSSNLTKANAQVRTKALETTSSTASLASSILAADSALFSDLSPEERPLAEALARTMQVGLGAELEDVSLRWTGWEDNFDGTNAAPEGGYSAVAAALRARAEAKGATFHLNEPVSSVRLDPTSQAITTTTSSGAYTSLCVIVTIPLGVLKMLPSTFFDPPLSARKVAAIQDTHVGTLEKLVLTYPSVWWNENVSSITILPSAKPSSSSLTSIDSNVDRALTLLSSVSLAIFSFSSHALPAPHPTLLIYVPHPIAKPLSLLPLEAITEAAHVLLSTRLGPSCPNPSATPPSPSHAKLTRWASDPFSMGATTTPSTTSERGERNPLTFVELGKPEKGLWPTGRLGFAGEHTEENHRGSVVGAVVSGEREGERVAGLLMRLVKNDSA